MYFYYFCKTAVYINEGLGRRQDILSHYRLAFPFEMASGATMRMLGYGFLLVALSGMLSTSRKLRLLFQVL